MPKKTTKRKTKVEPSSNGREMMIVHGLRCRCGGKVFVVGLADRFECPTCRRRGSDRIVACCMHCAGTACSVCIREAVVRKKPRKQREKPQRKTDLQHLN